MVESRFNIGKQMDKDIREYLEQKEQERKELRSLRIFAVGLLLLTAVCGVAMFKTDNKAIQPTGRYGAWMKN